MSKDYEYTRDSTRGRQPRIDPVNYKPDVNVQTWVEARKLLMLNNWMDKYNYKTRYMADIVKNLIDIVIDQLLEAGEVDKIEFNQPARDALKVRYDKVHLNPGGRGKRNVIHNLHLDEKRKQMMNKSDHASGGYGQVESMVDRSSLWEEAERRIAEEEEEERQVIINSIEYDKEGIVVQPDMKGTYSAEDRKADILKAKDALGIGKAQPTDGVITPSYTPISKHGASELLDMLEKKVTTDYRPRTLTPEEIVAHEQSIIDKDNKEKDSWDSVDSNDLNPS